MIELLEKANEHELRRSTSSDSFTSSSHSSNSSPAHSSPFPPSNQSPKITTTTQQNSTGAASDSLVQRTAQMKAPSGSTSTLSSTLAKVELRKDTQNRKVLPRITRTGVRIQAKDRSNQQPIAKPNVRYSSVKSNGISQQAISRVDGTFSQGAVKVGRAANQPFPKGRASTQTAAKQGVASTQTTSKEDVASSESTAKRPLRDARIISVAKENRLETGKPQNGTQQLDSSKTASTTSFRKVMFILSLLVTEYLEYDLNSAFFGMSLGLYPINRTLSKFFDTMIVKLNFFCYHC